MDKQNYATRAFSSIAGLFRRTSSSKSTNDINNNTVSSNSSGDQPADLQGLLDTKPITDDNSDLESVFGDDDPATDKHDKVGKRHTGSWNGKYTRPDLPRYSSFAGTLTYPLPSGAKSETQQRPMTASASLRSGMPEVQDFVQRPATAGGFDFRFRRSKSLRNAREYDRNSISISCPSENKSIPNGNDEDGEEEVELFGQDKHVSFGKRNPLGEDRRQRSAMSSPAAGSKSSTIILRHLHESLNQMLDEEDEIFKSKYSEWICELFHNELKCLRRKVKIHFNAELEELVASHEVGLVALEEKYQEKLMDFEEASQSLRDWLDTLEEENRQLQASKDWEVNQVRQEVNNVQKNAESQLEEQRSQMQAEYNRELDRLIREHEKQLSHSAATQAEYCGQLNTLQITVSNLQSQNRELQEQVTTVGEIQSALQKISELDRHVQELQEGLAHSERKNLALCELHEQEIAILKESADKTINGLRSLLATSQEAIQAFQAAHDEEVNTLQSSLSLQETQYNQTLASLQSKYASEIEVLTDLIDKIQNDIK